MFPHTAPVAALLTLIFVVLTALVIITRTRSGISLGDGGNAALLQAIRRQANFVENVPLALILMALAEAQAAASGMVLTVCGAVLVLSRLIHPLGLRVDAPSHPARIIGASLTSLVLLVLAVSLLFTWAYS